MPFALSDCKCGRIFCELKFAQRRDETLIYAIYQALKKLDKEGCNQKLRVECFNKEEVEETEARLTEEQKSRCIFSWMV